jgi:hypothetical protein
MKRFGLLLIFALVLGLAMPAVGAEFKVNGDFNNRFTVYTDQAGLVAGAGDNSTAASRRIKDDGQSDHWGGAKYRMWTTASTNDGAVKGVYAIEMGNLRYGQGGCKSRLSLGLQPTGVNYYLWNETAMGVQWYGSMEMFDYRLAWTRGLERQRTATSGGNAVDSFWAKGGMKPLDGMKLNAFVLFTHSNGATASGAITDEGYQVKRFASSDVDINIWNIGLDGSYKTDAGDGNLFFKWDAIYQTGDIDDTTFASTNQTVTAVQDMDLSAYFLHADAGYAWDDFKITGTFWLASGDDDGADDDLEGFLTYDVDIFTGSTVLMESYDDDNYFTERQHLLDKGMIMAKVAFDWNASDKLKVGTAVAYMLTAEDIEYTSSKGNEKEDEIGTEIMGYLSYKLYLRYKF